MDHTDQLEPICSPEEIIQSLPGIVYCARVDQFWTMEYLSSGCEELTGYGVSELLHNRVTCFEELIHPEDRDIVRGQVMMSLRANERYAVEYRIRHRAGHYVWVSEHGAPVASSNGSSMPLIAGHIQDATNQKETEAAFLEAERRYRSIFENTMEGIYQSTPDGRFITANPAFARMHGYDRPEDLINSVDNIRTDFYIDPERRDEFLRRIMKDGVVKDFESQVYRRDRSIIWVSENVRAVKNEDGEVMFFEGTIEDITKRKLQEAVAQFQATHDSLTGLLNRSALSKRLETALRNRPGDRYVAVLYVDVDQFKYINDSLGHHVGDQFLRIVASRLCSCLRNTDSVARQGGDEFIILLENLASREEAAQIAQNILSTIAQPWRISDYEYDIHATCSIGISIAPSDANDVDTMLRHADAAMFRAKALGRNNYRHFTVNLSNDGYDRLEWITRLRNALANGEFMLHYQPKIEVLSGRVTGAEALLRWRTADGQMISPAEFIPLAEEIGLIVPIGEWVLNEACRTNRAWQAAGYRPIPVSVNISAIQLERDDLVHKVTQALNETGLTARFLELEITESALMSDVNQSIATLNRLRELGVQIAIDDFGTGYSSLGHLKRFAVNTLKIDQSFIRNITTDRGNAGIVQAVISLAHTLGLTVVAEGVETPDEYRHLSARGCDLIQGYYTGRPVTADQLVTQLRPVR
ncbi:MAG TPA: EAL domain-containing protein [Burkholderiaceae bacterium]|nr:EAL domain-containing protein [Burkholderiaceae bacterium]